MSNKKIVNNTIMLMIFNIAKIIFPFITLPYLTRVLSTEAYGTVAYVKTVMTYMQIVVDFGFVLSAPVFPFTFVTKFGYCIVKA